jgi:hypothetical protein
MIYRENSISDKYQFIKYFKSFDVKVKHINFVMNKQFLINGIRKVYRSRNLEIIISVKRI